MRRLRNKTAWLQGLPYLGLGALFPCLCKLEDQELLGVLAEYLLIPREYGPLPLEEVLLHKVGVVDPFANA